MDAKLLDIKTEPFLLNCRAPNSSAFEKLRRELEAVRAKVLEREEMTPAIVEKVLERLVSYRKDHNKWPVMCWDQFDAWLIDVLKNVSLAETLPSLDQTLLETIVT